MTPEERDSIIRKIRQHVRGTGADRHNSVEALEAMTDEELQRKLAWYDNEARNYWRGR